MEFNNTVCEYIKDNEYIESFNDIKGITYIIYTLLFIFGLFITYFGNVYSDKILTILGFFPGFYSIYYIANIIANNTIKLDCPSIIYLSLLGGCVTTLLCYKIIKVAYISFGFLAGSTLGYILYIIFLHHIHIDTIYIYNNSYIITELLFGILGAILFYKKRSELLMIYTSFIGPYFILKYLDKLVFVKLNRPTLILEIENNIPDTSIMVIYMVLYIVLTMSGLVIQYKRYKKNNQQTYMIEPIYGEGLIYN
tara:strand:- start:1122 stop:1877 length:756 start_codon:yes stop_codon:yes gene_type:complete